MTGEAWQRPPSAIHQGWRYTIKTGHSRPGDVHDEDISPIAAAVVAAIKGARDFDQPGRVGDELRSLAEDFGEVRTVEEFDDVLSDLYDWADEHRVIIHGGD